MTGIFRQIGLCCLAAILPASALAQDKTPPPTVQQQQPEASPVTNVSIDGSETMFTTMCALLAAGFEGDVSAENWHPVRARLRDRMQHQQGPAVDAVRDFYHKHELADSGAVLSKYVWFGLVSGPAPRFSPLLRRDDLPPEVIELDGFAEILSAYYQEQKIGELWRSMQSIYGREIAGLHESISQIVFVATNYLRQLSDLSNPRTFTIIVEPLVGRITNVRNYGDHYAIVLSGSGEIPGDVIRHAYLHFLLDPLPLQYSHVIAVKRPIFDAAARAPRLPADLKDDFNSYFAECMVRAVELKLRRMSPSERETALETDDADGYVLVRPLFTALGNYERSEPSLKIYFPQLVRAVDEKAEMARVQSVKFAAAGNVQKVDRTADESVARRRVVPSTIPNDADAIAALTEGERRIAEKNPRAAEASFQRVLAKYPDQPRAWYGIGLVALMDHDAPRAKQVFQKLIGGENAAANDPLVLAWSHIYLARIYDDEGHRDQAKTEYQAALAVSGSPDRAKQTAEKELAAFGGGQ